MYSAFAVQVRGFTWPLLALATICIVQGAFAQGTDEAAQRPLHNFEDLPLDCSQAPCACLVAVNDTVEDSQAEVCKHDLSLRQNDQSLFKEACLFMTSSLRVQRTSRATGRTSTQNVEKMHA